MGLVTNMRYEHYAFATLLFIMPSVKILKIVMKISFLKFEGGAWKRLQASLQVFTTMHSFKYYILEQPAKYYIVDFDVHILL